MFSAFARFQSLWLCHRTPPLRGVPANDNQPPSFRRQRTAKRALVCGWSAAKDRLSCHWRLSSQGRLVRILKLGDYHA